MYRNKRISRILLKGIYKMENEISNGKIPGKVGECI